MEELYNSLFEAGDYTGSFEEFKDQFGDSTKSQTLYNALNEAGDYTGSLEDFNTQFEFSPAEDFITDDAASADAKSQEGVVALTDQEIEGTELKSVDTSLGSQKKNVIDADANIESVYDNYKKYADENIPVSYNFDNKAGQFIVDKIAAFTSGATELLAGVGDFAEMLIEAPVQSAISAYNYFADEENDVTQEQRNVISGIIEQTFFADDVLRIASDASSRLKTKRDDKDGVGIRGAFKEGNYLEAVDRTLSGIFEAVPSVIAAVSGPVGLGIIGASSTGQHYEEKSEKNPEERGLAMLGVSAVQGSIELASELVTRGIFKGVGGMVGVQGKALAKNVLGRISTGMFFEGTSEVASQEANNAIDQMWGLNKYYDQEGNFDSEAALTRVFDTFLISAALGGGVTVTGELSGRQKALEADRMMSPLQQKQNLKLSNEISELQKLNTGVDNNQIKEKIALKKAELLKSNARNREIVDGFSSDEKVEYLKILQNQTELKSEAKNLDLTEDQSKLNKKTQEQNISKLNSMYKKKADALAQERKARTLQFAEDAASLGIKSTPLSPEDFNKKAREVEISNISKDLDESKVAKEKEEINNTDYSKNSGGFFVNGEFFMNKDKLIELNQLNVGAHETLHPILNALVGNADQQGVVVEKFKNQLSKEQLDFMEGMMKARGYTENKNTYNKEYLTVFSDAIADKEIKYNETLFTKIGDMLMPLFRSIGFNKLKFDTGKDVYNFMREYSKSAEKGAISKDIKQFVAPKLGVTTDFSKTQKQDSKIAQDFQQELDNLDEFDFDNEFEYDQAVANLEAKIRSAKVKAKKQAIKKEEPTKEKTPQKTYDNEKLVETIKSEKTSRKEKASAEADLVDSFDTMALKAIKYDTRKGDYDRTEVRDYLRQFLPGILSKYRPSIEVTQKMLDGKAETVSEKQDLKIFNSYKKNNPSKQFNIGDNIEVKFSTWVYNNIAPKAQQTYEKFRKIADKSLDVEAGRVGSVAEVASTNDTKSVETTKKPSRKLKPIELIRDPELKQKYIDAIKKVVKSGEVDIKDATFGNLKDLAAEVTAEIFDIPLLKVTDPADNLAFADVLVSDKNLEEVKKYYPSAKVGMIIKSESSKIQDVIKSMGPDLFKLMPPSNAAPELASVDAQAYRGVKGTGLKIPTSLMKVFYEATGKRSKGVTSQVVIKELKKDLTYEQFLEDLGIKKGEANKYDRKIGQRLKAMTMLFGKLATNTEIRQLEGITDVQKQNIGSGRSDIQFSKTNNIGLEPSSDHGLLLEVQFSKKKRKEYENILSKKRPELRDVPKQVDELFKWADGLKVPDNKKSKYKKLALYYTANGYTIFPEDGYKIEEAIRLSEINKVDPYAYGNPDELINKLTKEEKAKTINPDNVKEFTNKRVLPEGVTIYDVNDSKAGQRAVRSVVDSYWGKKANPWCLIARSEAEVLEEVIEDKEEALFFRDSLIEDGYDIVKFEHVTDYLIDEYKIEYVSKNKDNLSGAWEMWKNYNLSGYGYEIAFQNGKLISFRDGGNRDIVDEYDVGEDDLSWWDRFDNPTDTLRINLGKKNGITTRGEIYFDEFTKKAEVEIVGYAEGDFMSRKDSYKLYDENKKLIESKVYKDGKISSSVKSTPTRMNDGGRARETATIKYKDGDVISTEKIIKDLRTNKIVTKSTTLNEKLNESSYIQTSTIVGKNGKTPSAPKVTEKNIVLVEKKEAGLNKSTEYYAEKITDGVSDVVIDRMSELNKIKESSIQFSKSVEKAKKSNNNMLPKSKRLEGDFTMDQVLDEMKSLDDQQTEAGIQFSNSQDLDKDFNDILEKKSGIASGKEYERVKAETVGAGKGRFKFFIPPSAEDFVGLLYATLGKGKTGDTQMAWYKKNLLNPFARAMENVSRDRNALGRDFRDLKKKLKIVPSNLKKKIPGNSFTKEQAIRVWIWNQIGEKVPGISDSDIKELVDYVNSNLDLKTFGTEIMKLNKGTGYISPTDSWNTGTITTDLLETLNTTKRKKYLELWQQNVDIIFSEKNLNKLEAIYGKQYREAMKNILKRMKTGRNRSTGVDSLTTRVTDWLTGSIGAIMFFNTRSAVLQTLSAVNFINFGDNNILAAGKAFANQKQYWTDFKKLFNSEFLIERRDGLKMNVNEADIADIAKERGVRGVINKLLKVGFTPTQIADSFAIASGGATFYRNRVKSLMKEGKSSIAAEREALRDFREIAEESQQSSRPDRISQQQAGPLGRIILAFANTPAQYARLIKKAASDLKNGRGDAKTNISKIIYYGVAQNLIFNAMQQALLFIAFGEEEEEEEEKVIDVANGMIDGILRGIGIGGAVFSVLKNVGIKLARESAKDNPKYENATSELLKLSPPISSKYSKVNAALRSYSWDKKEMKEKGFSLDNPAYLAGANVISATTNVPLDRVIKKIDNITASTQENISVTQRIALLSGWSEWQLGINKSKKSKSRKNTRRKDSKRRKLN